MASIALIQMTKSTGYTPKIRRSGITTSPRIRPGSGLRAMGLTPTEERLPQAGDPGFDNADTGHRLGCFRRGNLTHYYNGWSGRELGKLHPRRSVSQALDEHDLRHFEIRPVNENIHELFADGRPSGQ